MSSLDLFPTCWRNGKVEKEMREFLESTMKKKGVRSVLVCVDSVEGAVGELRPVRVGWAMS